MKSPYTIQPKSLTYSINSKRTNEILFSTYTIDTEPLNKIEEKFYKLKNYDREKVIKENFIFLIEKIVNETIGFDLSIRGLNETWVCVNMDSLYSQNIRNDITEDDCYKLLKRTKNYELAVKIISNNITISTLRRTRDIVVVNKQTLENAPSDVRDSYKKKFIKGYLVCLSPELCKIARHLINRRKETTLNPITIKPLTDIATVGDFIKNSSFNQSIWIKDYNKKVKSPLLAEKFNCDRVLGCLNFLNGISLTFDNKTMEMFEEYCDTTDVMQNALITKNKIINLIYKIDQDEKNDVFGSIEKQMSRELINSASVFESVKNYIKRLNFNDIRKFYISYRMDNRCRIYCYNYPINYQLLHFVRLTLEFAEEKTEVDIQLTLEKFKNHDIIKKYIDTKNLDKLFECSKLENILQPQCVHISKPFKWLKEVCWIDALEKLIKNLAMTKWERVRHGAALIAQIRQVSTVESMQKLIKNSEVKHKKILYKIKEIRLIQNMLENNYNDICWLDASSNAIQLIALRMGFFNEELLMLTNVINNETRHDNVYSYITYKLNNEDHSVFIKKIKNALSQEELKKLQNDEINKYRVMPGSYGMTLLGSKEDIKKRIKYTENEKIWNRLNEGEKRQVVSYLWDRTFSILKKINYDLDLYTKKCRKHKKDDWFNDFGLPIICRNYKKSKRMDYLKKLKGIKDLVKQSGSTDALEIEIKELNKKINKDEKAFWKRTKVKVKEDVYTIRVPNTVYEIDKRKQKQSRIPNAIHSYDSANIFRCIEICKELGIEALVIHDSIGCRNIYAPLVKIIYKIVNIEHLHAASLDAKYPNTEPVIVPKDLAEKILKSEKFFK